MASCYQGYCGPCPICDAEDPPEPEFLCSVCEDVGFTLCRNEHVFPCYKCSEPVTLHDLEEFRS